MSISYGLVGIWGRKLWISLMSLGKFIVFKYGIIWGGEVVNLKLNGVDSGSLSVNRDGISLKGG